VSVSAAASAAAALSANPDRARTFRDWGFRLIAVGTDQAYLANGAKAMLAAISA
jgi:2-keto-3-deoxy-L-rhamnonate aldolase RhmA